MDTVRANCSSCPQTQMAQSLHRIHSMHEDASEQKHTGTFALNECDLSFFDFQEINPIFAIIYALHFLLQ